jgi:hypothetical protein
MKSVDDMLAAMLKTSVGIGAGYQHLPKHVTPLTPLALPGAVLKWYGIHSQAQPIPEEVTSMARNQLMKIENDAKGMGFVLLHRCGEAFYFLIICTWQNSNELWQTVLYKENDAVTSFTLFPRNEAHKPTLCVWELVPVWHEQQAWTRFLASPRDADAAQHWLADCYAGLAG